MAAQATHRVFGGAAQGGPRRYLLSHTKADAAQRFADELKTKLKANGQPGDAVETTAPAQQQAGQRAAQQLLPSGPADYDWTDFVALVDDAYVVANQPDPELHPTSGDFAKALRVVQQAGQAQRALWAGMIASVLWRNARIADRDLIAVRTLRVLSNDVQKPVVLPEPSLPVHERYQLWPHEVLATTPAKTRDRHLLAAVLQLLSPST